MLWVLLIQLTNINSWAESLSLSNVDSMPDAGVSDTVSMMYEAASGSVSRVSGSVSLTDEGASGSVIQNAWRYIVATMTASVYPWPRSSLVYPDTLWYTFSLHDS